MILKQFKIIDLQFFLLALLPLAFVVGPLIVELIVNILIIFFIYKKIKTKDFKIIKNKLFIFLLIFYFILLFSLFKSTYFEEIKVNVFFYFRFIIFPFAVYEILKTNNNYFKLLSIVLLITISVVVYDGYYQFLYGKNLLGYEKYRIDRISGFFKDDLILGSYLSRILPLLFAIILYFKSNKVFTSISFIILVASVILIFLSGERAAFIKTIIGLTILFLIINIKWKTKILYLSIFISSIFLILISNEIIFDRYVNQMKNQIFEKNIKNKNNEFLFMSNYYPMYQTSFKMYLDSKFIGKGPKSYRYHCEDPKFITYFPNRKLIVDNTILKLNISWKEKGDVVINNFFVSENNLIQKGDKIFSYNFVGQNKNYNYFSDKEGIIEKIIKKKKYIRNDVVLTLDPQLLPDKEIKKISACNTHPHNFYIQLLAETGFLGFAYVFILFLYISFFLIKHFILYVGNNPKRASDSEISILIGFFLVLWPLTTNGNFFNNWINLINFYPLGIYLFLKNKRIND